MDARKLIAELVKENLCTYFILSLLKLGKKNFASPENFVDSFLTHNNSHILVKVRELTFFAHRMITHSEFECVYRDKEGFYYVSYVIPDKWALDVKLFMRGKFSQMSKQAHERIIMYSGLEYKAIKNQNSAPVTDVRLLALTKNASLQELWESYYEMSMEGLELLSVPDDKTYIDVEQLTKHDLTEL